MTRSGPVATRVIGFDYFDLVLEGVVKFEGTTGDFNFRRLHQGPKSNLFVLEPLPQGTVERVLALLEEHFGPGSSPVWVPVWEIQSDDRAILDSRLDMLIMPTGGPRGFLLGPRIEVQADGFALVDRDTARRLLRDFTTLADWSRWFALGNDGDADLG